MKETRREFLDQYLFKGPLVAAGITIINDLSSKTPENEQEHWVWHWDNTWKRRNQTPGIKFIFIPGLGHESLRDGESFEYIKSSLFTLNYDYHDMLDISYRINENKDFLGEHYDRKDSTQHPYKSLGNMNKLVDWYEKQFPGDKFIFIGHSQGGYLAYELARRHPDRTAAVISLSGALKGADIVPGSLDEMLAYQIGGEAGKFFINRGKQADEVEEEVARLVAQGIYFFPFSSTQDLVVTPTYSSVNSASRQIAGKKIETSFNMGRWVNWPGTRFINESLEEHRGLINNALDARTSDESAQLELRKMLVGSYDGHAAVLANSKVLDQIQYIVSEIKSQVKSPEPQIAKPRSEESENETANNAGLLIELINSLLRIGR